MMQSNEVLKQMVDINKNAYENVLKSMNVLHEHMEKMINLYIDQAIGMPEPNKNAAREWAAMYKKGFNDFQKLMNDNYMIFGTLFQEKTQEPK